MADLKISELGTLDKGDLDSSDKVLVLDVSDTSGVGGGPGGTPKKMDPAGLISFEQHDVEFVSLQGISNTLNFKDRLIEALNTRANNEVTRPRLYVISGSIGYTYVNEVYMHLAGPGFFGVGGTEMGNSPYSPSVTLLEQTLIDTEGDVNDLEVTSSIQDSINNGPEYITEQRRVFRRTISGEVLTYAYLGSQAIIGGSQPNVVAGDFTDITADGNTSGGSVDADTVLVDGPPKYFSRFQNDPTVFGWLLGSDYLKGWILKQLGVDAEFDENSDHASTAELIANQSNHTTGKLSIVRSPLSVYKYLGTTVGDITDYEEMNLSSGEASSVNQIYVGASDYDNTGATDISVQLQSAIDAATGDYLTIIFLQGVYKMESQISIYNTKLAINLKGRGYVKITPTFGDDLSLFKLGGDSAALTPIYPTSLSVKGIHFDMSLTDTISNVSVLEIDVILGDCEVSSCHFFGFTNYTTTGIMMLNVGNNPTLLKNNSEPGFKIDRCNFYNISLVDGSAYNYNSHNTRGIGIQVGGDDVNASEYWNISNCHFSNVFKGTIINSGANGIVFNCHYQYCNPIQQGTSDVEHGVFEINGSTDNDGKLILQSCKFNHNWGTGIFSSYTNDDRPCQVLSSQFLVNNYLPIKINGSDRFKIKNCDFDRPKTGTGSNKPTFTLDRYIVILNANATMIQGNDFISSADYCIAYTGTSQDNCITGNIYDNSITTFTNLVHGTNNNTVSNNVQTT